MSMSSGRGISILRYFANDRRASCGERLALESGPLKYLYMEANCKMRSGVSFLAVLVILMILVLSSHYCHEMPKKEAIVVSHLLASVGIYQREEPILATCTGYLFPNTIPRIRSIDICAFGGIM